MRDSEASRRVVVVTGAGSGIGRQVAIDFAGDGYLVVLAGRRKAPLDQTRGMLDDPGLGLALRCDHSVASDVKRLFAAAVEFGGTVDVLVNNASIAGPVGNIWDLSVDEWSETLTSNLTGPWLCARAASRIMIQQKSGSIISIGSVSGKRPLAMRTPYTTTKMGLVGLTRTLAVELGPYNITANLVSPGAVGTERLDELAAKTGRPVADIIGEISAASALNRISKPSDISAAVRFLASSEARNITGFDLTVDAGVWFS